MRKSIIVALATLVFAAIYAQDDKIQQIRKDYNELKAAIAKSPQRVPGGKELYCISLDDNPYGGSYPAVGSYRTTTQFYYELHEGREPQLLMAIDHYAASAQKMYTEVLYKDNRPVFVFLKNNYEGDDDRRLYLEGDQIIQYTENNAVKPYPNEGDERTDLKYRAESLLEQFKAAKGCGH
jgi:hypothetical protein